MEFYMYNPALENQIAEIRRKIRLSMNGVVSGSMAQYGIIYKLNYGVAIPRLREIAKQYQKSHDLAQRLWNLKIRETMILATLLEPEDKFRIENAFGWIADCNQVELVEQLCMNLLDKLAYANKLCITLVKSDDFWKELTGFVLSARIAQNLRDEEMKLIVLEAIDRSKTDNLHLYKAIALSLSRLCRRGKDAVAFIQKELDSISHSDLIGQQYISHEVKEEMLFLNFL